MEYRGRGKGILERRRRGELDGGSLRRRGGSDNMGKGKTE